METKLKLRKKCVLFWFWGALCCIIISLSTTQCILLPLFPHLGYCNFLKWEAGYANTVQRVLVMLFYSTTAINHVFSSLRIAYSTSWCDLCSTQSNLKASRCIPQLLVIFAEKMLYFLARGEGVILRRKTETESIKCRPTEIRIIRRPQDFFYLFVYFKVTHG